MAEIEVDGKKIEAEPGAMLIEALDTAGVWVPRFCYHKKLSIAANCRMCLVEVEKSQKPLPACATPITDGMKIWTRSKKAILAQKAVMEFLLINHPLDCPICDQGGECELQDLSQGYGADHSRYSEGKRSVHDKDIGPLIATDMTRCIHCTRCVRFGTEIAGIREMGATGRGEHMEIGTFIERSIDSEVSGNIIDLCPVGALTSKPFRFKARGFEMKQTPSISPHDCVGSNLFVHTLRDKVLRVVPRANESINEVWISDRDRFSYEGLSENRLTKPMIRNKLTDDWREVDWQEALLFIHEEYQRLLEKKPEKKPDEKKMLSMGGLASSNSTTEEFYLFQKWMRALGSHSLDHRLRQQDFRDQDKFPLFPHCSVPIAEIETQKTILLIGSDIRNEQPILGLKFRKMVLNGGQILVINPVDFEMNFETAASDIVEAGNLVQGLAGVAKALLDLTNALSNASSNASNGLSNKLSKDSSYVTLLDGVMPWLAKVKPTDTHITMAKILKENPKNTVVLLGALALNNPFASRLIALSTLIGVLTGAACGVLTEGANSAGAWIAGFVPHRSCGGEALSTPGLTAFEMSQHPQDAMFLLNVEPNFDCAYGSALLETLKKTDLVVALAAFQNPALQAVARVMLPICPFSENAGTTINAEGRWQSFTANVNPCEDSKPAWKVFRVLGNIFNLEGFEHQTVNEVLSELKTSLKTELKPAPWEWSFSSSELASGSELASELELNSSNQEIIRIATLPLYLTDSLVRQSKPLQATREANADAKLGVNPDLAAALGIQSGTMLRVSTTKNNNAAAVLEAVIDARLPKRTVLIPYGSKETAVQALGAGFHPVEITKL